MPKWRFKMVSSQPFTILHHSRLSRPIEVCRKHKESLPIKLCWMERGTSSWKHAKRGKILIASQIVSVHGLIFVLIGNREGPRQNAGSSTVASNGPLSKC